MTKYRLSKRQIRINHLFEACTLLHNVVVGLMAPREVIVKGIDGRSFDDVQDNGDGCLGESVREKRRTVAHLVKELACNTELRMSLRAGSTYGKFSVRRRICVSYRGCASDVFPYPVFDLTPYISSSAISTHQPYRHIGSGRFFLFSSPIDV